MSIAKQLLGPLYGDIFAEKKAKPAAKPAEAPKKEVQPPPPKKETFKPVPSGPGPKKVQYIQSDTGASSDQGETNRRFSPQELMDAADTLKLFANNSNGDFPTFDISDLKAKLEPFNPGELPLDVRPIAAISDTLYGTNIYNRTPNLRAERLDELAKMKSLGSDSQALQQVMGQAKLAEFKTRLKEWEDKQGYLNPLQKVTVLEKLAKAMNGGGSGSQLASLLYRQAQDDRREKARVQEKNNQIEKEYNNDIQQQQQDWKKMTKSMVDVRKGAREVRGLIAMDPYGLKDQTIIIRYMKFLEPLSAVMQNEANTLQATAPVVERIMNLGAEIKDKQKLTPRQRLSMLEVISDFERSSMSDYQRARDEKIQEAMALELDPKKIIVSENLMRPDNSFAQYIVDGKKVNVEWKDLGLFLMEMARNKKSVTYNGPVERK